MIWCNFPWEYVMCLPLGPFPGKMWISIYIQGWKKTKEDIVPVPPLSPGDGDGFNTKERNTALGMGFGFLRTSWFDLRVKRVFFPNRILLDFPIMSFNCSSEPGLLFYKCIWFWKAREPTKSYMSHSQATAFNWALTLPSGAQRPAYGPWSLLKLGLRMTHLGFLGKHAQGQWLYQLKSQQGLSVQGGEVRPILDDSWISRVPSKVRNMWHLTTTTSLGTVTLLICRHSNGGHVYAKLTGLYFCDFMLLVFSY